MQRLSVRQACTKHVSQFHFVLVLTEQEETGRGEGFFVFFKDLCIFTFAFM